MKPLTDKGMFVSCLIVLGVGLAGLAILAWLTACDCDDDAPACAFDAPPACEPTGQPPTGCTCDDAGAP